MVPCITTKKEYLNYKTNDLETNTTKNLSETVTGTRFDLRDITDLQITC
jgi:hypothetical protein